MIFNYKNNLDRHLSSVHEGKRYSCDKCDKFFTSNRSLELHKLKVHEGKKIEKIQLFKNYKTTICKRCKSPILNENHEKLCSKYANLIKNEQCTLCGDVFYFKSKGYHHIKNVHFGKKLELKCTKLKMTEKIDAPEHIKEDDNETEDTTYQEIEQESFPEVEVDDGKMIQRQTDGRWQCSCSCTKTFKSKQLAQQHMDNVHKGLKKYVCQQCNKSYTQSHSLKSHVQIVHKKISPFMCVLCGNSFKQRISIKRHMEKVHSGMAVKSEAAKDEEEIEVEGENGNNNEC